MRKACVKAAAVVAAFSAMIALMPPVGAQTWQPSGRAGANPVVVANTSCNSSIDTIGVTADRGTILTCQSGIWKTVGASASAGGGAPAACPVTNFRHGYWPGGYGSTTTYNALSDGPYSISSPVSFVNNNKDRGVAFDFGTVASSASVTVFQSGSQYFSVLISLDGVSWSTYLPYQDTGTTSYTANISGVSFRYVAITSGQVNGYFTGAGVNSCAGTVAPTACSSMNFKVGYWPGGYGSTTTYGALSMGPYAINLNSPTQVSAPTVDRAIAFDLGAMRSSVSITTTQNGSPYFSVLTSVDGNSWSTYLPYQNTGTTSYTANISGGSFRYVAITSGHAGYNFTSTVVNSCS